MKLHLTEQEGNRITACHDNTVYINGEAYNSSLLVSSDKLITDWDINNFSAITPATLTQVAEHCSPGMIVLLGAGIKSPPINPRWQHAFAEKQAVLEIMSLGAACRTYNFLNSDNRLVMALLIIDN